MPIKISGASFERYLFNSFLNDNNSEMCNRGSISPITDIFLMSKKEFKPSSFILLPPTPIKEAKGKISFRFLISEAPSWSPESSPATRAIFIFLVFLLLM